MIGLESLPHEITIEPPDAGTTDRFGRVGPGAAVTAPARVEYRRRMILDVQGQQVFTDARVFLQPSVTCEPGSWITYLGVRRKVVSTAPQVGLEGVHHVLVYLGAP